MVIAALDDTLMTSAKEYLSSKYPDVEFRYVPVDLGGPAEGYMIPIREATGDIPVNLIFNNAGYIKVGFFGLMPLEQILANINCNSISGINFIT